LLRGAERFVDEGDAGWELKATEDSIIAIPGFSHLDSTYLQLDRHSR
jgi:hypothetical protein